MMLKSRKELEAEIEELEQQLASWRAKAKERGRWIAENGQTAPTVKA